MVAFNGGLTAQIGMYTATIFIHVTGLLFITVLAIIKRDRLFSKKHRWIYYSGGAIGIMTVVFNNYAYGRISVSAILALLLFGQGVSGLIVDQYGWMGMPKHPFNKKRIIGLLLTLGGIAVMLDRFELAAVVLSFAAGITVVVSRTFNAKLALLTSVRTGTFYNYLVGTVLSIPVVLLLGRGEAGFSGFTATPHLYIYLGGVAGACVVIISNIVVSRIPAFYLSLLIFIGQIFSGVIIDAIIDRSFSPRIIIGGLLVATGLCADLLLNKNTQKPVNDF